MCQKTKEQLIKDNEVIVKSIIENETPTNMSYEQSFFGVEIKGKIFDSCKFLEIEIRTTKFVDCVFTKCVFEFVSTKNVEFINCKFEASRFSDSIIDIKFKSCNIATSDFVTCNVFYSNTLHKIYKKGNSLHGLADGAETVVMLFVVEDSDMFFVGFNNVNMTFSHFNNCSFFSVEFFNDTDLSASNIINVRKFFQVNFVCIEGIKHGKYDKGINKHNTILNDQTVFPRFKEIRQMVKDLDERAYIGIINSYRALRSIQNKNYVDENIIGETFYSYKRIINMRLKGFQRFKSEFVRFINGYGERWYNGLVWSGFVIFICSLIYMTGLVNVDPITGIPHAIEYTCNFREFFAFGWIEYIDWSQWLSDFGTSLYFSMMTFTTVGYGNVQATSILALILSFFQMFFGVILMTVTTGTLLRKIFR